MAVYFEQNQSITRDGGAMQNDAVGGQLIYSLDSCIFRSNSAVLGGGAIIEVGIDTGNIVSTITRCKFIDNSIMNDGGAISYRYDRGSMNADFSHTIFNNNIAGAAGGAIILFSHDSTNVCSMNFDSSQFISNQSIGTGGAIFYKNERGNSSLHLNQTNFIENFTGSSGGALYLETIEEGSEFNFDMDSCVFSGDTAAADGGAIAAAAFVGKIIGNINTCVFNNNTSGLSGGGISILSSSTSANININVDSTEFKANIAGLNGVGNGGGIHFKAPLGTIIGNIYACLFDSNHATVMGGALTAYADQTTANVKLDVDSTEFTENRSEFNAGAIYYSAGSGEAYGLIANSLFDRNSTLYSGGCIALDPGTETGEIHPEFRSCIFSNSRAEFGGGISILNFVGHAWPTISQCLFFKDTADYGGAFDVYAESGLTDPKITNCTFTQNVSNFNGAFGTFEDGGLASPTISNSIFWNNINDTGFSSLDISSSTNVEIDFSIVDVNNCDSLGSTVNCGDFMLYQKDPTFVNPAEDNYRLDDNSAAINTGSNSAVTTAGLLADINGASRIQQTIVDLGVYESNIMCSKILNLADITINPINYSAAIQVKSNGTITHMAATEFRADESVDLVPGFEVAGGATFIVDMNGCGGGSY